MKSHKGIITTYVLVFSVLFLLLLSGLLGFILLQLRGSSMKIAWNNALEIAEAGANYYRWCLNNGVEANCPLSKNYYDSAGNLIGHFSLNTTSTAFCGETVQREIRSQGWTDKFPDIKREINVLYAKTSVAKYAYILNDNVWIGSDHEIRGPYHSNGGIRMDGENQSFVSSAKHDWVCTCTFGCRAPDSSSCLTRPCSSPCTWNGTNCTCPGVFTTANGKTELFQFPVPPFDFAGLTTDLAQMKTTAKTGGGIYLSPSPSGKGYHIIFKNNGTMEARVITSLDRTHCAFPDINCAYSLEEGWHDDYFTITNEYLYNTYPLNPSCSVIFIEDNVWPEGEVKGKVTLASANLINPNLDTNVVLLGNINYTTLTGADGLSLIGERNVLIGPQSPNYMELRGIFIAQKGRFSRNHYPSNIKESLEINGSIVSNGRVGTQWISGSQIVSGYRNRETYFDADLIYNPPPFVPHITSDFAIVDWNEK